MIIRVKKVLLYGLKEDLDHFFQKAQQMGVLEFISHANSKLGQMPKNAEELFNAIRILYHLPISEEEEVPEDIDMMASRIVTVHTNLENAKLEETKLLHEKERIAPFGDFSLEELDYIQREGKRSFQFLCIPTSQAFKSNTYDELIYVGENNELEYFIAINKEWKQYPDFTEITFDKPLGMVLERLSLLKKEIHELEKELKSYSKFFEAFREEIVKRLNTYSLQTSKDGVEYPLEKSNFFAIQAWIPSNHINHLKKSLENLSISCSEVELDENEKEPTFMENKGVSRLGEDLVKIYDIPDSSDKDPSLWVMFFFTLFFSMITADAGYGLLYILLGFLLQKKYSFLTHIFVRSRQMIPRLIKLTYMLGFGCLIWGGLTGSFFGMSVGPNNILDKVTVVNYIAEKKASYHLKHKDEVYQFWLKKYPTLETATSGKEFIEVAKEHGKYEALSTFKNNILLECALIVGALHVCLGSLRSVRQNLANIGWVLFIMGGLLYFPKIVQATSLFVFMDWISQTNAFGHGIQLLFGGIGLALILSIFQKGWSGLHEPMHAIQLLADILSYLRLYALGLASTILAETFNDLGASIPFIAGFVVIILGHIINIVMGIMAGFIHGLRLNFLEWYHYGFHGNGRLLNPLYLIK